MIRLQPVQPGQLLRSDQVRFRLLCQRQKEGRMALLGLSRLAGGLECF